jgi:hypothetical protein
LEVVTGKIEKAQKIVVYGPEGIGKSTFASRFPAPIFIDTEDSTAYMDVHRTKRPSSWPMLMSQVEGFARNHIGYRTLVLDTADWAERLCIEHICVKGKVEGLEDFGYGKGYVYLMEEFGRLLNKLTDAVNSGMNVVVTAHALMRKVEQPEEMGGYDHWELKVQKKTAPLLKEWADHVLFANYKVYVMNTDGQGAQKGKNKAQGGKRVMYTSHTPFWDAKNRWPGIPGELPFDYASIALYMGAAGPPAPAPAPAAAPVPAPATVPAAPAAAPLATAAIAPATAAAQPAAPAAVPPAPAAMPPDVPLYSGALGQLQDLAGPAGVTFAMIQKAVADKGYFPLEMPVEAYPEDFVKAVLIGAWAKVLEAIRGMGG